MTVFRACRQTSFAVVVLTAAAGCMSGGATSAMAQSRNDLDALAYGPPDAAPQEQQPARPVQRGLFSNVGPGASSPGALAALAGLGSRFSFPRPAKANQPYANQPNQSYAQMQPRDLDAQAYGRPVEAYGRPVEAAPPPSPAPRAPGRGFFNGPSSGIASSGGAIAALGAGFRSRPRLAYARAPVAYAVPTPVLYHDPEYRLDAGDKLRIVVYGQEGLTNSYAIDAGGGITMPLIGGVAARGMTPAALASRITARLRDGFIREPSVAVEIEAYRPFFILGEVAAPGQYPYVPNMSVESAVAIAGGFSPRAKRDRVTLTHPSIDGVLRAVVPLGTPLNPGDTIFVGERWF